MKLALNTHNLAGQMPLETIIETCRRHGIAGIEFSVGYGHAHGIELKTDRERRRAARDQIMRAGLETASVASYCRFDKRDPEEIKLNLENAKRGIRLAADMDCELFRFVGNDLPDFMDRTDFIARMAEVTDELAEYAEEFGVTVLLNMHGSFQHRNDVARVMEKITCENAGLVYNCDQGDLIGGSADVTLNRIMPYIRHVHMHCMLLPFPYKEMFSLLKDGGYDGWYSIVVDDPSPEPDKFIGYYAMLARALYENA